MFVLKSKLDRALIDAEQLRHMLREANRVAEQHFQAWRRAGEERAFYKEHAARLGESRDYWQNKATEAEAKLADLQRPKRDAGAQAFDNIVRVVSHKRRTPVDADFTQLELRVLAHYGLTAAYGGTPEGAREAVYEGHAAEGGLQRHSLGDEYPFVVYGEEFQGHVRWRILDTRTGHSLNETYRNAEPAGSRARGLKKYNLGIGPRGTTFQRSK